MADRNGIDENKVNTNRRFVDVYSQQGAIEDKLTEDAVTNSKTSCPAYDQFDCERTHSVATVLQVKSSSGGHIVEWTIQSQFAAIMSGTFVEKNFSLADWVVFILLLLVSSCIGLLFAWRARHATNSDHFFTGNRKLGIFPVTMSLVASFMSTNTLLGVPAEVFQVGTQFGMQIISIVITVVLAAEVFLPVYYSLEITSVNEYLFKRFNSSSVKLAGTIGFILGTMPYLAVVLYGPAIALSSVTPIPIATSILVVGVICAFYTSVGGIKAVIWTDVLQCILMFFGVAIVIGQGLIELGGFSEAIRITKEGGRWKLFNFKVDFYNHDNFWNVILGATTSWGACYCVSQVQVQRYCSMKSRQDAKRTLYYNLPGLIVLSVMAIMSGIVVYGKYRNCDPVTLGIIERHDQLVPYFVMDTLSKYPGIAGLFVACVFSGSLSTLSSGFNALAAITWEDLLKERLETRMPAKHQIKLVKFLAMFYGVLAILMSYTVGSLGTVMQASLSIVGSLNGPLFGLFTIAITIRFVNAKGALCGFLAGFLISLSISMGSIILPRPHISLPTTYDSCPNDIVLHFIDIVGGSPQSKFIPYYNNPEGLGRLFHISYLIMSALGFSITVVIGLVVSLLTSGVKDNQRLEPHLLTPFVRTFWFDSAEIASDKILAMESSKSQNSSNNNNNNNQITPPHAKEDLVHELKERNRILLA